MDQPINRVAVIGDYIPRQCGIATFTADLCEAIAAHSPALTCFAVPVNDREEGYAYPPRVRFEFAERDLESYRRAADFLNITNVDVVCLEHEFGLFGGPAGSYILALLRELRMPVVVTLHTVLRDPAPVQRRVMKELAEIADRLIVMSERGHQFLAEVYHVPSEKIDVIPHGIPDVGFVDPNFYKDRFRVEGKLVLLTFGLLSANKGIEFVIEALPTIVARYPDVVYLVLGATHPHVQRHDGETYRLMLQQLARDKGVAHQVRFHDRFVSLEELIEFIGAADIYLTPYLNRDQITSGTLAYAVGAGKAVISTPYWHAAELLGDGRGLLVPFRDAPAIATRVLELLDNSADRHAMRKRAYLYGRTMVWANVATLYLESFQRARSEHARTPRPATVSRRSDRPVRELPALNLDHLRRLTDGTGIFQHAVFTVPRYSDGYCTDDNARALIATVLLEQCGAAESRAIKGLATQYMAFLWHAFNPETRRFRNFMAFERHWLETDGSADCHGRALWALGTVLGRSEKRGLCHTASHLFELALPAVLDFTTPRPWAFALLGIHEYLRRYAGDRASQTIRETLAQRLLELYRTQSAPDWLWFEPTLSYANAVLPHALLLSGHFMSRPDYKEAALAALGWLADQQLSPGGWFTPVGANGFYPRGGERARFDQQPIEAHAVISASLEAWRQTNDERWRNEAQRAFEWFLARNDLHLPLYDPATGGCRDGLQPDRINQNQGAESTLAWLLAVLELRLADLGLEFTSGESTP